jgi:acyl-CoA thioesterase-1
MNDRIGKMCAGWQKAVSGLLLTALVVVIACCDAQPKTDATPSAKATRQAAVEGTIVAVGDSLTAGLRVPEEKAYPAVLARKLEADGYAYRVVNAGVSGETSSGALSRIDWVIASLNPDIVILETGANDGLRGIDPKLLEANLDEICTRLKAKNIEVLLAGMKMLPNLGPEYTKAFAAVYPKMARKHDLVFMPFILKDVAGDPSLNQSDRLHPTAQGYARIADNIYPYVLQTIERHRAKKRAS